MTWLLVSTSPSALMTMPVPAAASLSYRGVVLMIARPSLTLVTMACSPLPLPDGLDEVTATAIVNPGVGAWLALTRRAMLQPGETVLVLGGHRRVRPDRGGAGRADGRQEAVGQGEDGPAANAGCDQPRAVAAALVQAHLPLLVIRRHKRGDQGAPLLGRQAGQHRVAEPGQVGAGPVEWCWARIHDRGGDLRLLLAAWACQAATWYSCVSPPRTCSRRIRCSARLVCGGR